MKLGLIISFIIYSQSVELKCLNCSDQNTFSVLIITETDGWVHDSIESGLELIQKIGIQNNFNVYYSDDSRVITYENLEKIRTIIFLNTTEEILTNDEQKLMESFIRSGKGFVGVHAAADTEYNWQWYGKLVGAYYRNHPDVMNGKILTINNKITDHLESEWEIEDEWYNFDYVNYDINILLNLDEKSYIGGEHPDYHPITWYHEYDGGRSFYTGLGHTKEVYEDSRFMILLEKGILYASFEEY
tara:strand:- start:5220 stop:5951 length:732 start_codon:yes stop_codon:yes gene_type:complete